MRRAAWWSRVTALRGRRDTPVETMKLGRRPPKRAPSLKLANILTRLPVPALSADHFAKVPTWLLLGNDQYGDCGPVSVANDRLLLTTYLTGSPKAPSLADVFDLYRRSGNPTFDPATGAGDDGVDMQTMLEALNHGGIAGVKCLAFAQVNVKDIVEIRSAIDIFGSLLLGVSLDVAQQSQTDAGLWDHKSSSAPWGGHAVMCGRYKQGPDRTGVITWATVVDATDAFLSNQLDEAWVVIWPESLGTTQFKVGIDLGTLASDYQTLTGRPLPTPTPTPVPTPPPTPAPTPASADAVLAAAVRAWASARHSGAAIAVAKAIKVWLAAKGL
jgi:hypothetical protein